MNNRPIKFRIWDKEYMEMLDSPVHMISTKGDAYYNYEIGKIKAWPRDTYEIMQFTGLFDKNSKDIYEGDIVKCSDGYIGYIDHHFGGFHVRKDSWDNKNKVDVAARRGMAYYCGEHDYLEVIGNILENPELLK